jgi:CHAT domain-containing protein/Tfp pilus assembly protein PilF
VSAGRLAVPGLILATALAATPKPTTTPAPAASGVIVETVTPGFEAAKAGIQPGDLLISWTRPANPPANPAPAGGFFLSPFDVQEVYVDQAPRSTTLTLDLIRDGRKVSTPILHFPWRFQTRPAFSAKWLTRYEEGRSAIEKGDLVKGSDVWRALAADLSAANQRVEAAWLWLRLGMKQSEGKQPDAAIEAIDQALREARPLGRSDIDAQLWGYKVEVLRATTRHKEGQAAARQALSIRERSAPEGLAVAYCLHELASVTTEENPEYEAINQRALVIRQRLAPGSRNEASSMINLSNFANMHGDSRAAIDLTLGALAINEKLDPASRSVAGTYINLCWHHMNRGELAAAEAACQTGLERYRALGPGARDGVRQAFHNLAIVARLRGELDRAVQLLLQEREICEEIAPNGLAAGYNAFELGNTELERNLESAEEQLNRAEQIFRVAAPDDASPGPLLALMRARIAYQRKDLAGSEKLLRQALAAYERTAPASMAANTILNDLGRVLRERGLDREAEGHLRRALALRRQYGPGSQETAESSHNLGLLLWKTGRLTAAEAELRRAIDDLEIQQGKLGATEESTSIFGNRFADVYKDYLALLMELHREQDAFLTLERFRAGSFLRTLAQRDLAAPEGIVRDLERERNATNVEYERTQGEIRQLDPASERKRIDEGLARLGELRQKQAELAERIKKASPKYGDLKYPRPLGLAEARAALDAGTLLLSYSVGEEKTFLFAVSADRGRDPLLSVFTLPAGEKSLRAGVEAFRRLIQRSDTAPAVLLARSRSLYDTLLKPAEALVGKSDRLLIVPDGPLNTLPWSALARGSKTGQPGYLAEWKPLSTVVSATVYAELRKARPGGAKVPTIELAAFGDPRYPTLAPPKTTALRGDETGNGDEEGHGDPEIDAVMRGGYRFEPLPRSRAEVESIAGMYAPRAEAFVGAEATEERAKSVGADVPLIHYACHAYVSGRFPLDSALVFTIPDKPKEGQDNGLLQAWEIFEKVRIDADLVTLSACETGLGKEMGGEGLIGLTRAFHYAGARSVLASLWRVRDDSTADLMKRFYGYLKTGKAKDEALRLAQIDLIRSTGFFEPRDWAAFQLSGDWK